jgi:hypothetical protein
MIGLWGGALAAGLLGSPHCVGMCGGFAVSAGSRGATVAWNLGRLTTYVVLGAVSGTLGGLRAGPIGGVIAAALLIWFSARLAGVAPGLQVHLPRLVALGAAAARRTGLWGRFALGVVTGLLPCGLLWSALAVAVAGGSPVVGAVAMAAFWVGTVPLLAGAAAGLRRLAAASPWARRGLALGVLAAGLWSISVRLSENSSHCACDPMEQR